MDAFELRRLVEHAISEGTKENKADLQRRCEEAAKKARKEEIRAEEVLAEVPNLIRKAAAAGLRTAVVMELGPDDYTLKMGQRCDIISLENLSLAATIVYNTLLDMNRRPSGCAYLPTEAYRITLEYCGDGECTRVNFNMTVSW